MRGKRGTAVPTVGLGYPTALLGWARQYLRLALPWHTSPRRIALGVSIGLFVAFLPVIGFQMGMALVIAWMFKASRPAAMVAVWVTNPLTMGPTFALTYFVGRPFWFGTQNLSLAEMSRTIRGDDGGIGIGAVFHGFSEIVQMGPGVFVPMLIGGMILGLTSGAVAYIPIKTVVTVFQRVRRRSSRRSRRGAHSVRIDRGPGISAARPYSVSTRRRAA